MKTPNNFVQIHSNADGNVDLVEIIQGLYKLSMIVILALIVRILLIIFN